MKADVYYRHLYHFCIFLIGQDFSEISNRKIPPLIPRWRRFRSGRAHLIRGLGPSFPWKISSIPEGRRLSGAGLRTETPGGKRFVISLEFGDDASQHSTREAFSFASTFRPSVGDGQIVPRRFSSSALTSRMRERLRGKRQRRSIAPPTNTSGMNARRTRII